MAQWNRQYTGNSHATKVKDLEETLIHAVEVYLALSPNDERATKEKAIRKIAEKLITARLKFLKAKLYEAEPVIEEKENKRSIQIEHLQQKIAEFQIAGVEGILEEFGLDNEFQPVKRATA